MLLVSSNTYVAKLTWCYITFLALAGLKHLGCITATCWFDLPQWKKCHQELQSKGKMSAAALEIETAPWTALPIGFDQLLL